MTKTSWIKGILALALSTGAALWGWYGWLIIVWVVCMALDYASGSIAAVKAGEWSSDIARKGLFKKAGMVLAVAAAIILDLLFGVVLRASQIVLPFRANVLVSALVLCWYSLTELGSMLENAVKLGAPVPAWLKKILKITKDAVDKIGDGSTK